MAAPSPSTRPPGGRSLLRDRDSAAGGQCLSDVTRRCRDDPGRRRRAGYPGRPGGSVRGRLPRLTTCVPPRRWRSCAPSPTSPWSLSDQRMPGLTGDVLLAEARTFHDAQAILLTGYADITAVIAALNRGGIVGYVTKPWDAGLLRSTVRQAFERAPARPGSRAPNARSCAASSIMPRTRSVQGWQGRFLRLNARKAARLGHDIAAASAGARTNCPARCRARRRGRRRGDPRRGPWPRPSSATGPTGAEQWSHVTRVPIRDAVGAISHLAVIERDVTEQRTLEARLRQSDKMQALGTLAGGIAHDFNNLLTAILGSLELAGPRSHDQPRVQRLIENARGAAERGASLTKRLLSFSRAHDLQARRDRRERPDHRDERPVRPQPRRPVTVRTDLERRPAGGPGRSGPARTRGAQPLHQRPRRHARGRRHHGGDAAAEHQRRSGDRRRHLSRRQRHRRGHRHPGGDPAPGLRAVLHHQGGRPGHRARARYGVRARAAIQGPAWRSTARSAGEPASSWRCPSRPRRPSGPRSRPAPRRSPDGAPASSSSTTIRRCGT